MNERDGFSFFDPITSKCWKCATDIDETDLIIVTNGETSWMELCPDCHDYYQTSQKSTSEQN